MEKYQEIRPWGKFERFCHNEEVTVKIITVKPNSKLSLQYHNHREEFWKIVNGSGQIVLGEKTLNANIGDEFFIPKKTNHRMLTKNNEMQVVEISFGEFDEDDIVRLKDDYDRELGV